MTSMKLSDGEVTLFHRTDSKNWQAEIRLPDGGRQTVSLRTANEEIAKERAIKMHDEIYFRHRMGLSSQTVTFSEAADAWIKELRAAVRAGARKERTVIDYEPVAERYLKPFFGDRPVDCIRPPDIARYRIWRRDYWVTGPGSKEGEFEYDRNGKTIKRKMAHKAKAPSPQTINGENVVLRGIFKFACNNEWMSPTQVPEVANVKLSTRETKERAYPPFAQLACCRFRGQQVKLASRGPRTPWG